MKQLKPFRFQLFQILSYRSLRGLAPEPPVSLATPRGQGSPLRFDTQPTGWSVGSAARHQGGIRKDCSAALLNLYKASPLTPFRFPPKPNSAGFGRHSRRAARGKSGGAGFGQRPRRSRQPAGRFRRPPESILLAAENDKSRRNRGQYDNDVLNPFGKAADLVVLKFVSLSDDLELPGLRANSRSL